MYSICITFSYSKIHLKRGTKMIFSFTKANERVLIKSPKVFRNRVPLIRKSKSMLSKDSSSPFSKQKAHSALTCY